MKNMIQAGNSLNVVLAEDTEGGDVVVMQDMCGIAVSTGKTGEEIAVSLTGVFALPKVAGTAVVQGKKLYWDATAGQVVVTATGNVQLGYAAYAASAPATTVKVLLIPA